MNTWPLAASFGRAFVSGVVETIRPFSDPISVDAETELLGLTSLGLTYQDLVFTFRNLSETATLTVFIDRSESGEAKNTEREQLVIAPGREGQSPWRDVLSNFFAVSAAGDGSGPVPLSWMAHGKTRMR